MLRRASLLLMIGLLTDAHPTQAAWTTLASLPEASFGAGAASQGGRLYLLGGFTSQAVPSVATWDGATWGSAPAMSQARMLAGAAAAQGRVFALGGFDENGLPLASAESFDPVAASWTSVASMPASRASGAAGSISDMLYVAGGQGDDGQPMAASFRFDPAVGVWTPVSPLPTPRTGVAGAVLDGRLWVMGGFDGSPSAVVERFEPLADTWSSAPPLPEPLWFPAAGVLDGRVWVVGGMDESFQRSDRVYSAGLDGVWRSEGALPAALAVTSVGGLSTCLVVAGGMDASGIPSALAWSQCVDPPPPPPPPPPPAETLTVAVTLNPTTLNAASNGQWISAHVVPDGWPATDIVLSSLRLGGVEPDLSGPVSVTATDLTVKFSRAAFAGLPDGAQNLWLTGVTSDGRPFVGVAAVTVQGSGLAARKRSLRPLGGGASRTGVIVSLDQPEVVRIDVLDLQGRIVGRLYQGVLAAGTWTHEWPRAGQSAPRGTYFVRMAGTRGVDAVRIAVLH